MESIEVHYMDTNPGMFSSKTLIYFRNNLNNPLRNSSPQGCNYRRHWGWQLPLNYKKLPKCFLQFDVWQYLTKVTLLTWHFWWPNCHPQYLIFDSIYKKKVCTCQNDWDGQSNQEGRLYCSNWFFTVQIPAVYFFFFNSERVWGNMKVVN